MGYARPFGFGKYAIKININDFPEKISKELKQLYNNRLDGDDDIFILGEICKCNDSKKNNN